MRLVRVLVIVTTMLLSLAAYQPARAQDLDCGDFPSKAAAQRELDSHPSDIYGLDADHDGRACELGVGGTAPSTIAQVGGMVLGAALLVGLLVVMGLVNSAHGRRR